MNQIRRQNRALGLGPPPGWDAAVHHAGRPPSRRRDSGEFRDYVHSVIFVIFNDVYSRNFPHSNFIASNAFFGLIFFVGYRSNGFAQLSVIGHFFYCTNFFPPRVCPEGS